MNNEIIIGSDITSQRKKVCNIHDLLDGIIDTQVYIDGSYRNLPQSKSEIMKWLRSENILSDENVQVISQEIDTLLLPRSLFIQRVYTTDYWNERDIPNLLVKSILIIKITRGIQRVFDQYPPCN